MGKKTIRAFLGAEEASSATLVRVVSAPPKRAFFMTTKQANLIALLNTFENLLEDTFDKLPPDLTQTIIEIENFVRNTKPKA